MDKLTASKNHIPCQSWAGQNDWSTASTQGSLLNPLPSSQHLSLGSSSDQRRYYDSALYSAPHINSNPSPASLFANTAIPSASHSVSFAQQGPHTSSMLLNANQGKNIPPPSLSQTNQAPQPCGPQLLPLLSPSDPYKASFQPPLTSQGLPDGLQDLPLNLPSCGQRASTSQASLEGAAGVSGYTHSHASSTSQEQRQWMPSSHSRGAMKESVPDAAAYPNKEPSQEGNMSPLASSERQRLLLLQHRAQLLKQVAELDTILESMHPGDSTPQHTAVQSSSSVNNSSQRKQNDTSDAHQVQTSAETSKSQSDLSSDCSSPASYDEQSEAGDISDDQMSTAESVEQVIVKSEGDSDPDYLANSDHDFSDPPSDNDGGSFDESGHSRPSTPTEERPSLPQQKDAKAGSSSSKDKRVSPPKQIRATNPKKKSTETVILPILKSTKGRDYNRKNYCLFCAKPVSKMSRHLERIHSDKPEVAAVFQYPKNSRERQKMWNKLVNQGNFAHNKDVLKTGKGQLVVRKRTRKNQKVQDYLHCLHCRGLFARKALFRHMKSCPEKVQNGNEAEIGRKRIALQCVLEAIDLGISDGFKSILSQMTYNDVTQVIMEDEVILQFGELLYSQHGSDPKRQGYVRQNLRHIARLVLEAQKTTPLQKLEDFFLPSSFPYVVSAVNVLAGYNPETKTYSIPSLAIKLGYHLQKTCGIVEANAVKRGDASLAESARNFLSVYQEKWNKLISGGALTTLRKAKLNKSEKKVLFAEDVKLLFCHMENAQLLADKNLRESPCAENYAALAKVILARTILFNRRSALEVYSMQIADFTSRKKSDLLECMDVSVSDLEKTLCGIFTRIDIRGKCGRMVPVLLKPSFVSALELLIKVRETCGVPSKNPFLFGRPHTMSAYHGSECIQKYIKACGAKDPEAMISSEIRKRFATMLQLMSLDDDETDQIFGPNNQVRSLRENCSMQLNDVEVVSDERGHQAASLNHNERSSAHCGQAHGSTTGVSRAKPPKSIKLSKKGSQNQGKQKWDEAEVRAVEKHLMHLIEEHKVPQKNDCVQCLEAEPEALKNRSWKGVKDYVRNRITTLKRKKGSSRARPAKRN